MAKRIHRDVEFAVDGFDGKEIIFKEFNEAAGFAVAKAISNGEDVNLDVLVYSSSGAKALEGDDGVEEYKEDPDASVYKRIVIKANDVGRVP